MGEKVLLLQLLTTIVGLELTEGREESLVIHVSE